MDMGMGMGMRKPSKAELADELCSIETSSVGLVCGSYLVWFGFPATALFLVRMFSSGTSSLVCTFVGGLCCPWQCLAFSMHRILQAVTGSATRLAIPS